MYFYSPKLNLFCVSNLNAIIIKCLTTSIGADAGHRWRLSRSRFRSLRRRRRPIQTAQTHVVDDLLDLLHIVLERIEALAQAVVLQVQQPEAGVQIGDKVRDVQRPPEVAERHRVGGEARQLGDQLQQPHQVVLDVQMEAVRLVDFHWTQPCACVC